MKTFFFLLLLPILSSCGSMVPVCRGPHDPSQFCIATTDDDQAIVSLNEKDFDAAIDSLEVLITHDPLGYMRYPRLSAAYAGRAGVDLLTILTSALEGGESEGPEAISAVLPSIADYTLSSYLALIKDLTTAIQTLDRMPLIQRRKSLDPALYWTSSAQTQYFLYTTSLPLMCVTVYDFILSNPDQLETLSSSSSCDASQIFDTLLSSALEAVQFTDCEFCKTIGQGIDEKRTDLLAQFNEAVGDDPTTKLLAALAAQQDQVVDETPL